MNANELADAMDTKGFRYREVKAAVKMLRQQQAEIDALNEERNRLWKEKLNSAKTLTDEDVKYNVTVKWDDKTTHHKNVSDGTPLHYNEPMTLTDEEIIEYVDAFSQQEGSVYVFQEDNILEMIHSILRKAQEK